uniref:ATP-dependent RNA helicase n=1 Tax=Bionectria ochroleuca TaxID=29856 RepID=A0A0B7K5V9_BIOOC
MAPNKSAPGGRSPRAWDALTPPLAEWILDAVSTMGFKQMTPVQAATIPHFMGNKDVVVEAVTGSGKTLSFLVPAVQRILRLEEPTTRHHVAAIIVSPTRELAAQIHSVLLSLLEYHPPSAELLPYLKEEEDKRPTTSVPAIVPQLLVGGTTTVAQDLSFFLRHSPNILISSPGRLVELLSSPYVHCPQSSFQMLVLDEADRLLDLGFKQDLQKIISHLPKQRRTGLFSASVSEAVGEIIRVGLRNPVKIEVRVKMKDGGVLEDRKTPASLQMAYLVKPASQKLPALAQILEGLPIRPQRTIVFLSTCAAVDYFQHVLPELLPEGFALIPLHGKHQPKVREKNFNRFLTAVSPTVLLTTDLAAHPKVFIHRSGRAGRAGRKGLAVVMLHPGPEEDYVRFLEIRKTPIALLEKPEVSTTQEDADQAAEKIRSLLRADRALHDKAQRAFVSWGWGLLRMPKMPELKSWQGDKFLGVEVDWDNFAYLEKSREKARQEALEAERSGAAKLARDEEASKRKRKMKANEAWSNKHDQEDTAAMTDDEKVKQAELDDMIRQVRMQNAVKTAAKDDEFEGFDD